jgi:hypothetical protein
VKFVATIRKRPFKVRYYHDQYKLKWSVRITCRYKKYQALVYDFTGFDTWEEARDTALQLGKYVDYKAWKKYMKELRKNAKKL